MFPKYYNDSTLSTPLPTQKVVTSNLIRQIEVNMANEPLKVEKPLLESSSEIG